MASSKAVYRRLLRQIDTHLTRVNGNTYVLTTSATNIYLHGYLLTQTFSNFQFHITEYLPS